MKKMSKLKPYLLVVATCCLFLLLIPSCSESPTKQEIYEPGIITMVTKASEVKLGLNGIGEIIITCDLGYPDWRNKSYNITLSNYSPDYATPVYYIILPDFQEYTLTLEGYITHLHAYKNELTYLDVRDMPSLLELYCGDNQLSHLDVSKNKSLEVLHCEVNLIENLNVRENIALRYLGTARNKLSNLDVSQNILLTQLSFYDNKLTNIDINNNILLETLYCDNNQLRDLDLSNNTSLTALLAQNNQIEHLDLKNNIHIEHLYVFDNNIHKIDIETNSLVRVYMHNNKLDVEALDDIFRSLNTYNPPEIHRLGDITIWCNIGENECDRSIAEDKGWLIQDKGWLTQGKYHPFSEDKTENLIKNNN